MNPYDDFVAPPRAARALILGAVATLALLGAGASPAGAGGGGIDGASGILRFEAAFRTVPDSVRADAAEVALARAAELLCDATDGQVRVGEIRLTTSPADEDLAALWLHEASARSGGPYLADGSGLVRLGSHMDVFAGALARPDHLAHLLAHHAFGLGDQYGAERRWDGACGIGPGFEEGAIDERNHSLMQGTGHLVCAGGEADRLACAQDGDCPGGTCAVLLASELSVSVNHDNVRGVGAVCPRERAVSRITLRGALPATAEPVTNFDASDFLTARATSSHVARVEALDSSGRLPGVPLDLYFTHKQPKVWTLTAATDGAFTGGSSGDLEVLEQWDITFNDDGSLRGTSENPPSLVVPGRGRGVDDTEVAIDIGTPNPNADREPGIGFDGLQLPGGGALSVEVDYDGVAACRERFCAKAWNMRTGRWETSEQTLLHDGRSDWETLAANYPMLGLEIPSLPSAAAPEVCAQAPDFIRDEAGSDQVVLVLDASLSTSWPAATDLGETCGNGTDDDGDGDIDEAECGRSTFDFLRAAARTFAQLTYDEGVRVGVVAFGDTARSVLPIATLDAAHAGRVASAVAGIEPAGATSIGPAIEAAYRAFETVDMRGRSQTALLITEGRNNTPLRPGETGRALGGRRVRWMTVPVGGDADVGLAAELAATSAGTTILAPAPVDLPAVVAEMAARYRGEALIVPRTRIDLARDTGPRRPREPSQAVLAISVEERAEELIVYLGSANAGVESWSLLFELSGPSGERIGVDSPLVHHDGDFSIIRVPDPRPGAWRLRMLADGSGVQRSTVLAWARNRRVDLFVDVWPRDLDEPGDVVVSARPTYSVAVGNDVNLLGTLVDPSGARREFEFERDPITRSWTARLGDLHGRGLHEVIVRADVGDRAQPLPGEPIFTGAVRPPVRVVPFTRTARTSFYVRDGRPVGCQSGDCDGDGIANSVEDRCGQDADGDGVANRDDLDSDNDEAPDRVEGTRDSDGDGLADFCDPAGTPQSMTGILAATEEALALACPEPGSPEAERAKSTSSAAELRRASTELRGLAQTIRASSGALADSRRQLIEPLEAALEHKRKALIVADALPEFCNKYRKELGRALEIERRVAADVEAFVTP